MKIFDNKTRADHVPLKLLLPIRQSALNFTPKKIQLEPGEAPAHAE